MIYFKASAFTRQNKSKHYICWKKALAKDQKSPNDKIWPWQGENTVIEEKNAGCQDIFSSTLTKFLLLMILIQKFFENVVGKGENAGNQNFVFFFPTVFSTLSETKIDILATFSLSSWKAFNLVLSKVLFFCKELHLWMNDEEIIQTNFIIKVTPLPEDKIIASCKLKTFADGKLNAAQNN